MDMGFSAEVANPHLRRVKETARWATVARSPRITWDAMNRASLPHRVSTACTDGRYHHFMAQRYAAVHYPVRWFLRIFHNSLLAWRFISLSRFTPISPCTFGSFVRVERSSASQRLRVNVPAHSAILGQKLGSIVEIVKM